MCLEKPVVRRVQSNSGILYFKVELPEPRVVYVAVDQDGDYVGISDVGEKWRIEVARQIRLAVTGI